MGLLLIDEEIRVELAKLPIRLIAELSPRNAREGHQLIAKAQLKKVVEEHKKIIEGDGSIEDKLLKVQDFWQAILKEIE